MIASENSGAHSAQVEMQLIINGESIGITHMGPDFLIVESGKEYPPGEATIVLQVDQSERRWTVRLPCGLQPGRTRVSISK
ncbi:MAG TPA: hypothetical protein VH619_11525 [Verrucomicrobiae bacterium]|jgi:hypothetical protein|nr:hypothetical protein [Verrucomicrobiae bacterium]